MTKRSVNAGGVISLSQVCGKAALMTAALGICPRAPGFLGSRHGHRILAGTGGNLGRQNACVVCHSDSIIARTCVDSYRVESVVLSGSCNSYRVISRTSCQGKGIPLIFQYGIHTILAGGAKHVHIATTADAQFVTEGEIDAGKCHVDAVNVHIALQDHIRCRICSQCVLVNLFTLFRCFIGTLAQNIKRKIRIAFEYGFQRICSGDGNIPVVRSGSNRHGDGPGICGDLFQCFFNGFLNCIFGLRYTGFGDGNLRLR